MGNINNIYYNKIMGMESEGFLDGFQNAWNEHTKDIDQKYFKANQMSVGHRLRPLLAAWGFSASTSMKQISDFKKVIDIAVSIELIHKSSIIIDDLIDEDNARHGKPTFHIEHSKYEAIVFVVYLLGLSMRVLNKSLKTNDIKKSDLSECINLITNTICDMSYGTLKELNLKTNSITNLKNIQEIINLQTVSLIKNSILIGYLSSGERNQIVETKINSIGHKCGYLFQLLNDAEPFAESIKNKNYKGNVNYDFNKSRKNIVVSYLYGMSNTLERKKLKSAKNLTAEYIINLFTKYKFESFLKNELINIEKSIYEEIEEIQKINNNQEWKLGFQNFINYLFSYCIKRLSL